VLAPETVLQNRYRVIRQLGQGGMGAVYEAIDERLDTTVALKETLFADERLRKQFEREARLLARMHHPALPRVSDHFGEADGQFLVMQFIAGDDLAEMIARKRGPFPTHQVATWADQLLDALDYLHSHDPQIIHRDIKPQNLKLTTRGQIILLDFGLAKGQASEVSRVTTAASIFGYTPNYAPLEQIQGLGTDARSDIYALGATLYHLVTGVKPPDALTRAAAIVNGQPDPLKPAHEINSALNPALAAVLQRALAQNRDQRYVNAAEMRKALKDGSSPTAISRGEADTMLLPPAAPTVSAATRPKLDQPTEQAGETTVVQNRPASNKRRVPWAIAAVLILLIATVGGFYAYQRRNNSAAVPASNNESTPAVKPAEPEKSITVTGGNLAEENKQAEAEAQSGAAAERAAKKNEQSIKQKEKQSETRAAAKSGDRPTHEVHPEQARPVEPEIPEVVTPDVPPTRGRRGLRSVDGVTIRNFPDGTQLITSPDGSRVVIRPDGTRRVYGPGEKIDRRKMRAQPPQP
jgi:eukaryotic-like serine/threonine-protein kinase